jgi:hypothetical protein
LDLIECFSRYALSEAEAGSNGPAACFLVDPVGRQLFEAMTHLMGQYRAGLLAAWIASLQEIEDQWVAERLDEARYFNPEEDEAWYRDVEAETRNFFRFEGTSEGREIYMTDELRDYLAQGAIRPTPIWQVPLVALGGRPKEIMASTQHQTTAQPTETQKRRSDCGRVSQSTHVEKQKTRQSS